MENDKTVCGLTADTVFFYLIPSVLFNIVILPFLIQIYPCLLFNCYSCVNSYIFSFISDSESIQIAIFFLLFTYISLSEPISGLFSLIKK